MYKYISLFKLGVLMGVGLAVVVPQGASAQRQRPQQNLKKVLVLPPIPADREADSAFSIAFVEEARKKVAGKSRGQFSVTTTEKYCEALEASGFSCGTLLDETSGDQLATFMSVDGYIVSRLTRDNGAPVLHVRLVEKRRSGLGGAVEVEGTSAMGANDMASAFADALEGYIKAAKDVRDCSDRRDRSDFRGARSRAERVFTTYPNHPGAAMCVAYLFEATQQPADSLIWAYRKAATGDPASEQAWDRLIRHMFQQGDTLGAIEASKEKLSHRPWDDDQRIIVAGMYSEIDRTDEGIAVINERDEADVGPPSETYLQRAAAFCVENEAWDCALSQYSKQYEMNGELASDSTFMMQVIGAADFAGDTVAGLHWSEVAVTNFPDDVSFLQAYGARLRDGGNLDSAQIVLGRVTELDPSNTTARLFLAQMLIDGIVIDSTTPLDTTGLRTADEMLTDVGMQTQDDAAVQRNVGALYFKPGQQLANLRMSGDHARYAVDWLTKSLDYPLGGQLETNANFFLGFATVLHLPDLFEVVRDSEDCDRVEEYATKVTRGREAITAGQEVSAQAAQSILQSLEQYDQVTPNFRQAFSCSTPQ